MGSPGPSAVDGGPPGPFARAGDGLHLVFGLFLFAMALASLAAGRPRGGAAVAFFGGTLAATALLVRAAGRTSPGPSRALRRLHLVYPLFLVSAVFAGLRFVVPALPVRDDLLYDQALARIDRDWFGVDVVGMSVGAIDARPLLADALMVFYVLYFLMPVVLLAALLLRGQTSAVYPTSFVVSLGLYASYVGYLLVPAFGPRAAYVHLSPPLPRGNLTGALHDILLGLEPQPYDAFPSAHVVMGVLCAVLAWPLGGVLRWGMAVVAAGTVASTLLLRYHYLVDDLAALAVVAAALLAAGALQRRAARRRAAPGGHGERMEEFLGGG